MRVSLEAERSRLLVRVAEHERKRELKRYGEAVRDLMRATTKQLKRELRQQRNVQSSK